VSVDQVVIEEAVLQVFSELQVPPGGRLSLETLRAEWPRTRLRRSDLVQGLRGLVFSGDLELDEEAEGPMLILRVQGHERMQARSAPNRSVWTLLTPKKPPAAALRQRSAAVGPPGQRRKSDQLTGDLG